MSQASIQVSTPQDVVSAELMHLSRGQIEQAIACFAQEFTFKDHGIGLEFSDARRLTEFFQRKRELYPDALLQSDRIFVSGDYVITEWTLQGTITETYYSGLSWKIPLAVHGASVVRIDDGKIAGWADYYDGVSSRRTALAAHFTEWVEY